MKLPNQLQSLLHGHFFLCVGPSCNDYNVVENAWKCINNCTSCKLALASELKFNHTELMPDVIGIGGRCCAPQTVSF